MLQIRGISKTYRTGALVQKALDDVSLSLRDSEFVAILGQSGSGKTTLLNVIGGLDRYAEGDLIINGASTGKYNNRDWDAYRNHSVGFVFQSYNLIPHQTVLANVELALTISGGISMRERSRRAKEALARVGLADHIHKKPSQLSGGQMQRVAIARALVNDPDILLADEPTGALDSETSLQVMDILKEVASDRLVVMVTHNPELAEKYATRIVRLRDGRITDDSDPFEPDLNAEAEHRRPSRASMSFLTALNLSLHNLWTKKVRTLLVAFAGSIGIIGIAAILSMSNGADTYIRSVQEETLKSYPLQITATGMDLSSLMSVTGGGSPVSGAEATDEAEVREWAMVTSILSRVTKNDLAALREYIENGGTDIYDHVQAIEYDYNIVPQIYKVSESGKDRQVNPDRSFASIGYAATDTMSGLMTGISGTGSFYALPQTDAVYRTSYELKAGHWPESWNECVLVLSKGGFVSDLNLYAMGLRDPADLDELVRAFAEGYKANVEVTEPRTYNYADFVGIEFKLVPSADKFTYDPVYGVWSDRSEDGAFMNGLLSRSETLTVVGVIQPAEDNDSPILNVGIGYPYSLTERLMEEASGKEAVEAQLSAPDKDIFTGREFEDENSDDFSPDLSSLFNIDKDVISSLLDYDPEEFKAAFADMEMEDFDLDELDLGSLDLGELDLEGLDLEGLDLEGLDLEDLDLGELDLDDIDVSDVDLDDIDLEDLDLGEMDIASPELTPEQTAELISLIKFNATPEDMQEVFAGFIEGYLEYAANDPRTDYAGLSDAVTAYLATDEARDIIVAEVSAAVDEAVETAFDTDVLTNAMLKIMLGFPMYLAQNGMDSGVVSISVLDDYLRLESTRQVINEAVADIRDQMVDAISMSDLSANIGNALYEGYREYAEKNAKPDPSRLGDSLSAYAALPGTAEKLTADMAKYIDTSAVEKRVGEMIAEYAESLKPVIADAVRKSVEQIVVQVAGQVAAQAAEKVAASVVKAVAENTAKTVAENVAKAVAKKVAGAAAKAVAENMETVVGQMTEKAQDLLDLDPEALADAFRFRMSAEELRDLMTAMLSSEGNSCDANLRKLGYADFDNPSTVTIYPVDFEGKQQIKKIIDDYNAAAEAAGDEDRVIVYTDLVDTLMSSVTSIINAISIILIAFVAVSLVVSSVMIGVITYISVLERRKEIGILRAIGASRRNVSNVFNAETFIIGALAGVMGILITMLLIIPANIIIHDLSGQTGINAILPPVGAVLLIILSIVLTLLGGLIPSRKAARSDPVAALREN